MATDFRVPGVVASPALDLLRREELMNEDLTRRQRYIRPKRAKQKTEPPPEEELTLTEEVVLSNGHIDLTV